MTSVPAYRVTAEDLPDADQKTLRALQPLLERLNRSLTSVIATLNSVERQNTRTSSFLTDGSGNATVTLGTLAVTPKELWVTSLAPALGSLGTTFLPPGWTPTTNGAVLSFRSLSANTAYLFTARYL